MRGSIRTMAMALTALALAVQPAGAGQLQGPGSPGAEEAPASAAPHPAAAPPGAIGVELVDGRATLRGPASADPLGRRDAIDLGDPTTYLDGVRAAAAMIRAIGVTSAGEPADLDGDGLADVLVTAEGDDPALEARRGLDGALLWSVALGEDDDAFPLPVGDLTGDGRDDLLVWSFVLEESQREEECAQPSLPLLIRDCTTTSTQAYRWEVGARSGADGSMLWSRTIEGVATWTSSDEETPTSRERAERDEATAYWVWLDVLGDVDGDGLPDLVLQVEDRTTERRTAREGTPVASTSEERTTYSSALSLEVLRGASGAVLASREAEEVPGWINAYPNGPDATELLWAANPHPGSHGTCEHGLLSGSCFEAVAPSAPSTSLLDAATLETSWTRSGRGYGLGADVDGAGAAEVAFTQRDDDEATTVRVVRGEDGSTLWSHDATEPVVSAAALGDVDGDGLDDVVVLEFPGYTWAEEGQDEIETGYRAHRLRGTTGQLLGSSGVRWREEGDGLESSTWVHLGGDHDADGVGDLVATLSIDRWDEEEMTWSSRDRIVVESGADGAVLYELDGSPYSARSTADLTGDGADELLLTRYRAEDREPGQPTSSMAYDHVAVRIADGAQLWSHTSRWSFEDRTRDTIDVAGDQDGEPGAELLRVRVEGSESAGYTASVRSLDGVTLQERWRRDA